MGCRKNIDEEVILRAEERFEALKEGRLAIQLGGIIAFGDNTALEVAEILRVTPRSVFRWVKKFKEKDVEGLREKPKGHYKGKLTTEQKTQIKEWIKNRKNSNGKTIYWTLRKLRLEVRKEFGIVMSSTGLWYHLRDMNLTVKTPRPVHQKADKKRQEDFKKQ